MVNKMLFSKKETIDFLFLSEVKLREENALILLTEELKRRGYNAKYLLFGEWGAHRIRCDVKVLVINSCFGIEAIEHSVYAVVGKAKKVVTLRWEQIESNAEKDKVNSYEGEKIVNTSKTFNTFAWGKNYYDRMIKIGMKEKYIHMIGPIFMDFLRFPYDSIYLSEREIKEKYFIPYNKKILLYISDFSMTDENSESVEWFLNYSGETETNRLIDFERKTQTVLLEWFEKFLKNNGDKWVIVYRPHPGCSKETKVINLSNKVRDFYVISELSGQQWIKVADKIATSYSTMISEITIARKSLIVLRPYTVPETLDFSLYSEVISINKYEMFVNAVLNDIYSTKAINIDNIYDFNDTPCYIRASNKLEEIYWSNDYNSEWDREEFVLIKRKYIIKRIVNIHNTLLYDIKHVIKKVIRVVLKSYHPKSNIGKLLVEKATDCSQHNFYMIDKIVDILNSVNSDSLH